MNRIGCVVCIALSVAGCATKSLWYKDGGTRQEFNGDRYACLQESQQRVSSAYVGAYGGSAQNSVRTNGQLFDACMNARGWELRPAR